MSKVLYQNNETQETIYLNRDFCIVSFGNDKCVIYTDMSDTQAQKGWISWREVDIDYYEAIKKFIESGDVEKKGLNNYIETLRNQKLKFNFIGLCSLLQSKFLDKVI